ncbi:MAG TPA: hypothetical protein VNA89_14635 [Gemmatimonadaceae bacterium]|nr:hypothetical protein [Gemmatimonadaceae bacterium]
MPRNSSRSRPGAAAALALAYAAACTTGATFRSGVAPANLDRPPYYAGALVRADTARVAYFPIAYPGGGDAPAVTAAGGGSPVRALLAEMNAYLDSLDVGAPVARAGGAPTGAPDVRFGCPTDASGECAEGGEGLRDVEDRQLRLEVGRPSPAWVAWAGAALEGAGASRGLVVALEATQYWPRQRNLRGDKEVQLGTGHTVSVPWLTALDRPVSVLQLTGALLNRDGTAARIGAEGLLAHRTPFLISAAGVQALISDDDVERLRTLRRDDLPGTPLVWQVALRTLVGELTGRTDLARR